MKMSVTLDLYLWNHFIPKISIDFFRSKFNAVLVMAYVSLYRLPRKFLINYFLGKGKVMVVDSKELITRNPVVFEKLKGTLRSDISKGRVGGSLHISQTDVYNPIYKYSVGSFNIKYLLIGEAVILTIESDYKFQKSPERLTKYLHNWLYTLKSNGNAQDFEIIGIDWITDLNELILLQPEKVVVKIPRLKLLV